MTTFRSRIRSALLALSAVGAVALATAPPLSAYETEGDRKILVWGARTPITNLDPHQRFDNPHHLVQSSIYEPLVKYRGNPAKIVPWLAESWEETDGSKVWVFRLAANAKFQNGDPLDAEAVRFSFERALKINKAVSWMLSDVLAPDGISVVDARTVRFTLKQSYPSFLSFLPWWLVVNPKQVMANETNGDLGQAWMAQNTAGSGPFRIKRWEQNQFYQFEAVPDYWNGWPQGEDKRLGGVIYKIIREPSAQRTALTTGQADIVEGLTSADYVQVRRVPGIVVQNNPGSSAFGIKFNYQKGPTADVNLRRAIAHAFDYDAFIALYGGDARLLTSPFLDVVQGKVDIPDFPRKDLAKAKEYLAKSPWPNGGIELDYVHQQGNDETRRIGLLLLSALQELNIKVNIKPLLWANMVANAQSPDTAASMTGLFTVLFSTDPDAIAYQYHKNAWGQWFGVSHYNNPEVFELIEKARSTPAWSDRAPMYAEIQKRLTADQPEVFGYVRNVLIAHRDYVKGYEFTPMRPPGYADWHVLSIDDKR